MYKKILAPIDGSELSECAVEHIKAIAVGCNVPEVILFRAIEPMPQTYMLTDDWIKDVDKNIKTHADEALSKIAESLEAYGIKCQKVMVNGYAANEILDYADHHDVDLIIMSTHGSSGFIRWTLGSVTEKVARHSPIPVLIVTPKACQERRRGVARLQ
jgi:nucleotide-binding universal stress UspA family protein